MWIKICANTNLPDARLAASLGADALGFVFAASKRQVRAAEVAAITGELAGSHATVERIGVFDTQRANEIVLTVRRAGLSGVQLHGRLDAELVERLAGELGPAVTLIQTISWVADRREQPGENGVDPTSAVEVARQLEEVEALPAIGRVLIDSRVGSMAGGTGIPFQWGDAARVLAACRGRAGLIVAGGLRPDNVPEAIRTLQPWGVDVASGVEASPGRKDPEKLARFLARAREATA